MRCYLKYFLPLLFLLNGLCRAQNTDIDLLQDMCVRRNTSMDGAMKLITNSDYAVVMAVPLTELMVGHFRHDSQALMNGLQTLAGYAINGVITYALKYSVARPRPFVSYPYLRPYEPYTSNSFPSGHTSFAFNAATSLTICYPRWYVAAPAYLWASAVGYSRLHLGVHYPSDVLAGAIVGAGTSWLAYKGNKWLQKRKRKMNGSIAQ